MPADAVTWDAEAKAWVPVEPGTTAVSTVTFDYSRYLGSNWHDGQPITLADAVYSIAQGFDLAYDPDKAKIEIALAATSRPYLETFKGYRIIDDDRLEVYVDYWHFDEDTIAAYASPTSLRHALGGPGGHGRPRLRAAPRGLQRHGRGALRTCPG